MKAYTNQKQSLHCQGCCTTYQIKGGKQCNCTEAQLNASDLIEKFHIQGESSPAFKIRLNEMGFTMCVSKIGTEVRSNPKLAMLGNLAVEKAQNYCRQYGNSISEEGLRARFQISSHSARKILRDHNNVPLVGDIEYIERDAKKYSAIMAKKPADRNELEKWDLVTLAPNMRKFKTFIKQTFGIKV